MDEDWLTVVDAAFRMTRDGDPISWRTISKYRDSERIPSMDQGGIGLVRISDVLAYEAVAGIKREEQVNNGVMKTDALLPHDQLLWNDQMKVKVTTERECCDKREDLQTYHGKHMIPDALKPKFCKHCGQLWYLNRHTDAAGSSDSEYVRHVPQMG